MAMKIKVREAALPVSSELKLSKSELDRYHYKFVDQLDPNTLLMVYDGDDGTGDDQDYIDWCADLELDPGKDMRGQDSYYVPQKDRPAFKSKYKISDRQIEMLVELLFSKPVQLV